MIPDETIQKVREEFVHGFLKDDGERAYPSLASLATRHSVSQSALYDKAKKDDWQGQKNKYHAELQEKLDAERMRKMVEESSRLDDSCIQIAQAMLGSVGRKLQRSIEQERADPEFAGLDPSHLSHLAQVTANAQKIGKLALGEAQEISKVSADVRNPDSFRAVLQQLDELAASRSQVYDPAIH